MRARGLHQREAVVHAGQDPGRARGRCDGDAMRESERGQVFAQLPLEARPRPEQAQAGADFQHDRLLERHADLRAVAIGPGREEITPARDFAGVVLDRGEIR